MPILCKKRFEIVSELEKNGIQTRLCMAGNILRQPGYAALFPNIDPNSFIQTERIFRECFLIGLHQGLSEEDIDFICTMLLKLQEKFQ